MLSVQVSLFVINIISIVVWLSLSSRRCPVPLLSSSFSRYQLCCRLHSQAHFNLLVQPDDPVPYFHMDWYSFPRIIFAVWFGKLVFSVFLSSDTSYSRTDHVRITTWRATDYVTIRVILLLTKHVCGIPPRLFVCFVAPATRRRECRQ